MNICPTAGMKAHWYEAKCKVFSEATFLTYFITTWFVFFSIRMCFLIVFVVFLIKTICFYDFCKKVWVKSTHLAKLWFDFPVQNAIIFTLVFMWYFNFTIKAPLSLRTIATWKNCLRALPSTSRQGICALNPANQSWNLKNDRLSLANCFTACTPKIIMKLIYTGFL